MTDLELIESAIADGYYVAGYVIPVKKIQHNNGVSLRTGCAAQSVDAFINVFNLQLRKDAILDPENKEKFIIILKKTDSKQIEILTSDAQCVRSARQQLLFQNEPIGIAITVYCVASGGSSDPYQIAHVDRIIPQLDGFWNWSFKQTEIGKFEVSKKLNSTNDEDAKQELKRLHVLLNHVAIMRKTGIRVERYAISKIPRFGPYVGAWGPTEFNLPPLAIEEIKRFEKLFSAPPEIREIADGLNQTYLLKSLDLRLAVLWAITEKVFADEPKPLLSKDETKDILESATKIKTLNIEKERWRLEELRKALCDPNRLPLKSRNMCISENIAKALKLNVKDVSREISKASKTRGTYVHKLKSDPEKLHRAESFLRTALETFLEVKLK